MLTSYIMLWFPMVGLAILNGAIREKGYAPYLSERTAHQISCLIGMTLFTIYTYGVERFFPLPSAETALMVGLIWLVLTLLFEFGMICLLMQRPLRDALAEYNLLAGRLWVLVLAAVLLLPWIVYSTTP